MNGFKRKMEEVAAARQGLQQEKERLAAVLAEIEEQELQTASLQKEQKALLARIATQKKLHQRAIREMESSAANLAASLSKLWQEAPVSSPRSTASSGEGPNKKATPASGLTSTKGQLQPPVIGTLLTRFGQKTHDRFGNVSPAIGIDIRTRAGAKIKAIYQGKVVYSGYLRGYGNLLIIDHGQQYYSLMSRAARFFKKKEEPVHTGEVIGMMGDQADALAEGLHFEIRYGSEPQDPLLWLDAKELQPGATPAAEPIQPELTLLNRP